MATTLGTPRLLRAMNDRAVLDLLLSQGPLSCTMLGNLTGLSKPTASQLLVCLEAAGLVCPSGTIAGRLGPNAQLYEINGEIAYVVGLDVMLMWIWVVVVDLIGNVVGYYELVMLGCSAKGMVDWVVKAIEGVAGEAGLSWEWLRRVSIGMLGGFDPMIGWLWYAMYFLGWYVLYLFEELVVAIVVLFEVENDVNLVAVVE